MPDPESNRLESALQSAHEKAKSLMLRNPSQRILGKDSVAPLEMELQECMDGPGREGVQALLSAGKAKGVSEILTQAEIEKIAHSLILNLFFRGNGIERTREVAMKLAKTYPPQMPAGGPSFEPILHLRQHALNVKTLRRTGRPVAPSTPSQSQIAWAALVESTGGLELALSLLETARNTAAPERSLDITRKILVLAKKVMLMKIADGDFEGADLLFSRYGKSEIRDYEKE